MTAMTDEASIGLPDAAASVLTFWFGAAPLTAPRAEWFRKEPAFDEQIRQRFGTALQAALSGALMDWDATPGGGLARIVLLDQFTRNAFRGTAQAFAGDTLALTAARGMVQRGDDRRLAPLQRWFVYLPFEHCEDLAMQDEAIRLFEALAHEHPGPADATEWAHKHREVVLRFGRFPHRNAVLGRASTQEELEFLSQPGSTF